MDTDTKSKCKDEIKDVEKKCDLSKKDKKKIKEAKKKSILKNNDPPTWKDKYCKGLGIKIMTKELTPDEIKEKLEELTDVSKQAEKAMGQVKEILIDKATEYAAKKTAKVIAKSAVKGWLGPVGWAWTAYDVVSTGFEIKDMYDEIDNLKEDINRMKNLPTEIEKMKADGITADDLHNAQALIAAMNPCLRARKCMLVPYSPTKQNKKKKGDGDTRGCCPGQTPHHLIPKSHFIKDKKNIAKCRGYDEQEAPTVCAEGPSYNKGGTHQSIHDVIEPLIMKKADDKGKLTYAQARENAIKSHELIYGQCKEKCLEAQIDNYHKKACGRKRSDFKVRASSPKNLLNGGTYSNKPNRNGGGDGSKL